MSIRQAPIPPQKGSKWTLLYYSYVSKIYDFGNDYSVFDSSPLANYSKEHKSVTAFDLFTFFRTDLIQSEASWKMSSTSDWLMSA